MLPDQAINEYRQLYEKHYGEKLSFEEAKTKANKLINFYSLILEPNENEKSNNPQDKSA